MIRKVCVSTTLSALVCSFALGQNTIVQWNTSIPRSAYVINQTNQTIEILVPGGYDFKFYAVDGTGTPGTGVINNITVAPGATGDFTLLIDHPDQTPIDQRGALQWNAGDLRYAGGTCTIVGIDVRRNGCDNGVCGTRRAV